MDLHILIARGMNIAATIRSVTSRVCYTAEQALGLKLDNVNVFVDGMMKAAA